MRYLIKFSYDGSSFSGFQKQKGLRTVEGCLENAASKLNNSPVKINATGRTDKGVHAKCQYANFDLSINATLKGIKRALNSNLPEDIHVIDVYNVRDDFNARYEVKEKTYKYYLNMGEYDPIKRNYVYQYCYKLDVEAIADAIKYFIGEHDFRAFVTDNVDKDNCVRVISDASIERKGDTLIFIFTGNGFMRYEVRNLVGALLRVGQGKDKPIRVKEILDSKVRCGGLTAKAEGLYLENIEFKDNSFGKIG